MQSKIIRIKDTYGNENVWLIKDNDGDTYIIESREVQKFIKIKDTYKKDGKLHGKIKIDIGETNIELPKKPFINKMCWNCGNCDRNNDYCKVKGDKCSEVKYNVCYSNTKDDYRDIDMGYLEDENVIE